MSREKGWEPAYDGTFVMTGLHPSQREGGVGTEQVPP